MIYTKNGMPRHPKEAEVKTIRNNPNKKKGSNIQNTCSLRNILKDITPSRIRRVLAFLLLTIAVLTAVYLSVTGNLIREPLPEEGTSFVFFSVGQANCTVIHTKEGNVMIDTGSNASEEELSAALAHYGIDAVELLVLSHADEDHAGGLDMVLASLPVTRIMMTPGTYHALLGTYAEQAIGSAVRLYGTELLLVAAGETASVGILQLRVLAPSRSDGELTLGGNEASLILHVSYGETDAIFPGDADTAGELRAVAYLEKFLKERSIELLLVGHHGSSTSSGTVFLEAIRPEYAVISCGKNNSYGHPTGTVLARLTSVGAEIFRTDLDGTVILHSDGKTIDRLR